MMADELQMYQNYERFTRCLLKLAGVWPRTKDYGFLYGQLPSLTVALCLASLYGIATLCSRYVLTLHVFIRGLSMACSVSIVMLKATFFRIYRADLRELTDTLESLFTAALKDPRLRPVTLSSLRSFYRTPYIYFFLTSTMILACVIIPLVMIGYQFAKGVEHVRYALPLPVAFPWNIEGPGFSYVVIYLMEVALEWFFLFMTSGVEAIFCYYVFQMSGLLRVMSYEFATLNFSDDHGTTLKRCVQKHNMVLRCRDIIQNVYGPIVLYLAVTNAFLLCAILFRALQTDEMTLEKSVKFLSHILLKLLQTLMYSWYGSVLTTESEVFQREVYCSRWYESGDTSVGKQIIFLLMQKPIVLTGSHIVPISVDLFAGIVNTALSYFFLLVTLDDEN